MTQLTLEDVQCVCELFPHLEELSCAVASHDAVRPLVIFLIQRPQTQPEIYLFTFCSSQESIGRAIEKARNLHLLKLHVYWIPAPPDPADSQSLIAAINASTLHSPNSPIARFGRADAIALMRRPGSRLTTVSMGPHVFRGSWVQKWHIDGSVRLHFEVEEDGLMGRRRS